MNNKPIVPGRVVFAFILERYNLKSAEKYGKVAFAIESKNPPSPFQGSGVDGPGAAKISIQSTVGLDRALWSVVSYCNNGIDHFRARNKLY